MTSAHTGRRPPSPYGVPMGRNGVTRSAAGRTRAGVVLALVAVSAVLASCSSGGGSDASAGSTTTAPTTTTTEAPSTTAIPASRQVEVHVPPGYSASKPAPLLVLLHGYGTTGQIQSAYLGLEEAVDAAGMLYVYPDGTENQIGKQYWNATDACCAPRTGAPDDSAYLAAVIAQVKDQYNVDPRRVFLVGHSNGGFMSYRMACDHADEIAAIVSLEAATFDDPKDCTPSGPVSVLEVHGTGDRTIPYRGGKIAGRAYPSAPTTVKTWAAYDGCSSSLTKPRPATRDIVADLPSALATTYDTGCDAGSAVELWTQPQGVHIPRWTPSFKTQIVEWLLAHPKPKG